jgi:exopolysaccharide biosynthesis protein
MKVFYSDEKTAEEYLEDGAMGVLAFGPILIRDGELNEEGIKKYGTSHAQRTAVGMVEKGHYWFMMLEGRIKRSKGDGIRFLAEKLMEKGCTLGFNLDGGDTSCIVFMGHQLCKLQDGKKNKSSRRTSDILGIGHTELLPSLNDPW